MTNYCKYCTTEVTSLPPDSIDYCPNCQDVVEGNTETAAEAFRGLGLKASFHFADDSTKEWHLGSRAEAAALRIFDDASPEEQAEMREIAKGFLWRLNRERASG